jgi:hypothetical protein
MKKNYNLKFWVLCALCIIIPLASTFLLTACKPIKTNTQVNQNFNIDNYIDGVKIIFFYYKDSKIYANLSDSSTYFVIDIPKDKTVLEIETEIENLSKYENIFVTDFLKKYKGF